MELPKVLTVGAWKRLHEKPASTPAPQPLPRGGPTASSGDALSLIRTFLSQQLPTTVATFEAISVLHGAPDGAEVFCLEGRTRWRRHAASLKTPDDKRILTSAEGGNWLRLPQADPSWQYVAIFYVKPSVGKDRNDGTLTSPLETIAEVIRRLQNLQSIAAEDAIVGCTVILLENIEEVVTVDDVTRQWLSAYSFLQFQADPIPLHTGTLTSVVDYVDSTHTVGTITDTALPVEGFAPYVGKLCRITASADPANVGVQFFIEKDLTNKTAVPSLPVFGEFDGTIADLDVGDTYEIYDLIKWTVPENTAFEIRGPSVDFYQLEIGNIGEAHSVAFTRCRSFADSCIFHGLDLDEGAGVDFSNCCVTGGNSNSRLNNHSFTTIWGGLFLDCTLTLRPSNHAQLVGVNFRGVNAKLVVENSSIVELNNATRFFDMATPIIIRSGAAVDAAPSGQTGYLWGTVTGAGQQVSVDPGGRFTYLAQPSFTGGGTELFLGGLSLTWAQTTAAGGIMSGNGAIANLFGSTTGAIVGNFRPIKKVDTDSATIAMDFNVSIYHEVTLAASGHTITPSNLQTGGTYRFDVVQGSGGNKTVLYAATVKFGGVGGAPVLSTGAGARDNFEGYSPDGTNLCIVRITKNVAS